MNKRRLIVTSVISVLLVSILMIGSTYSIFTSSDIDENTNVYQTGNLNITYTVSEDNIQITNSIPMTEEEATFYKPYRITVTNTGTVPYMFNLILNDTTAGEVIDYHYIMIKVGVLESKALIECTNNIIKEDIIVLPNESVDIDVRIWISDKVSNDEIGKSFYGKLSIDGLAITEASESSGGLTMLTTEFIEAVMKANAQTDADIDFSKTSAATSTNGIYLRSGTETNAYPIYYYRGAVDNNLIFAETCWKIVRTTETGGLKLIYNGAPTDGQCNNTGAATQIGTKKFNSSYNSPAYVGYMYSSVYTYSSKTMSSITDTYYYGNDVTYSNGTYTLNNTITSSDWSSIYNGGLNSNHYTCFTTGTTCSSVYYISYTNSSTAYYITLSDGKKVEDALTEMLGADDENISSYNTTSSTIKGNSTTSGTIDYWYYNNIELKGYSDYLEDTVWCNDRTISAKNGWDPNGGSTTAQLYFSSYNRIYTEYKPNLTCSRNIDSFTVSEANGNGDLNYPVGLLTADEVMLAGGNSSSNTSYYLYTGQSYWLGSPYLVINAPGVFLFYYSGNLSSFGLAVSYGVRPVVSLKLGFKLSGNGDGSVTNPYIVE